MSNITIVTYPSPISSLPSYLCALPSHQIDLSYQDFTTLTDATFPCLDSFNQVILSYNQITSVNMTNGNFTNLTILDLSSNLLTTLPYSILRPTPTSLRYLNLANNSITSIDLFLYTLKNITVNLNGNPINSSNIINPENATLASNTSSTVNITFPPSVTTSIIIIQDTTAAILFACSSFAAIRSFLLNFRSATTRIFLECTCASYSLKELYQENGANILSDFGCSNPKQQLTYESLTNGSCANVINFQTESCNAPVQVCLLMFNFLIEIINESIKNKPEN
jgi:Leucine-rich repeat (LRR) protein